MSCFILAGIFKFFSSIDGCLKKTFNFIKEDVFLASDFCGGILKALERVSVYPKSDTV